MILEIVGSHLIKFQFESQVRDQLILILNIKENYSTHYHVNVHVKVYNIISIK